MISKMEMPDFGFNGRYILDEAGNPMPEPDLIKWAMWHETAKRQLAFTQLESGTFISTVFLGLDLSWGRGPEADPLFYKPTLWESLAFDQELLAQRRYISREAARAGHLEMVEWCKEKEAHEATELNKLVAEVGEKGRSDG